MCRCKNSKSQTLAFWDEWDEWHWYVSKDIYCSKDYLVYLNKPQLDECPYKLEHLMIKRPKLIDLFDSIIIRMRVNVSVSSNKFSNYITYLINQID